MARRQIVCLVAVVVVVFFAIPHGMVFVFCISPNPSKIVGNLPSSLQNRMAGRCKFGQVVVKLNSPFSNPLSPSIKLQLLLCFHAFLTEVVGRSC